MVDLKAKPFYLKDEDIAWVEETIRTMTDREKIGQLFFNVFSNFDPQYVKSILDTYHIGGARYMGETSENVFHLTSTLQMHSKVPVFVAANCDAGGNGACKDGTYVASGAQTEASGSEKVAYDVGYVSGREATAIGVNWNFDPCADILFNWRNTIVNTRAYGTDADTVIKYTSAYIKGLRQSNIASCIKHFPGDGVEERDQHLLLGVNDLSVEEWDKSFGKVYKTLIDEGVMTIMAGHIALPEYQKKLVPGLKDEDVLPATLAPELITGLLREQLGFNGLVVTDASHMLGLAAAMKRRDLVPRTIAAGCDMFLFFRDHEEDFGFMMDGYKQGIISEERLNDALHRILGLKAAMKMHNAQKEGTLVPKDKEGLKVVGCAEHRALAEEAADLAITLVKNTKNELPIRPETHKRIMLYVLYGEMGGVHGGNTDSREIIKAELEKAGFEVTMGDMATNVGKTADFAKNCDAALIFSDIQGYGAENNYRIRWKTPTTGFPPYFVHEVPTVFVSLNFTTHLTDVPMVKTYINAYKNTGIVIRQVIRKIMGDSPFKGKYNDLVWCDKWDTRL